MLLQIFQKNLLKTMKIKQWSLEFKTQCTCAIRNNISSELRRIWGSQSSGYEEFYLPGCNAMKSTDVLEEHVTSLFRVQEQNLLLASCLFLAWLIQHWRWSWHVPPECWLSFNGLHSVISQKTGTLWVWIHMQIKCLNCTITLNEQSQRYYNALQCNDNTAPETGGKHEQLVKTWKINLQKISK
jgi:hypothetical protein